MTSGASLGAALCVGAGAAIGAILRWWLGVQLNGLHGVLMMGTLAANLVGAYLMGLMAGSIGWLPLPPELRLMLVTGFLGGLTTFSAFSGETVALFGRGQVAWGFGIIALHVLGSLAMTALGWATVHLLRH